MGRAFEYRKASKLKRRGAMSRLFPKLAKAIEMAAKARVPDPEMNSANYTDVNFEGKGPHGALIFVETATDNNTRTVANVKMYFNKNGGSMAPTGSLEFMFDRKALFEFNKTEDMDIEELELELIDAGLEEIEEEDGIVLVTADYTDFGTLNSAFEEMGIELTKAKLERISNNPQTFTEEQEEEIGKLLEKLEDDDDVQAVYTNMA